MTLFRPIVDISQFIAIFAIASKLSDLTSMEMNLPPRVVGEPLTIDTENSRQIIIIGANGSGKTRFASRLASDMGDRAFRVSALKALYGMADENLPVNRLYNETVKATGLLKADITVEFDRLIALLLNEEILAHLESKYQHDGAPRALTRLDKVIAMWEEIFPANKILIESGRMLFGRTSECGSYPSARLSDGERAVIYYIGAALLAPPGSAIFVDSPDIFLHRSSIQSLWNRIEQMRQDCTFVYTTHDLTFASSRSDGTTIWVKNYDPEKARWDYDILQSQSGLSEELYLAILGARKPVLFIEGDGVNSFDAKLYPLIFKDYTVASIGGCNQVIEATRTFNSLSSFHNLDAAGLVDRDRRDPGEVKYLRSRKIFVPEVAEIENIFMLEEIIRTVASHNRRNEDKAFEKVRKAILHIFEADLKQQALLHTRHKVKKTLEHRIDGRFANINKLEEHINDLAQAINPRGLYEEFCREFRMYLRQGDYNSILRVYNRKSMLVESHVTESCGVRGHDKNSYVRAILSILREDGPDADRIRRAVELCIGINQPNQPDV